MPLNWEDDKRWAGKFLPEMKRICGEHLIGESPAEDDQQRNTDLIVLKLDAIRIACRVRKFQHYFNYGEEFTIRSGRRSGVKTELAKIIEGWGNYILYCFADEKEEALSAWMLGDLNVFRLWFNRECMRNGGRPPGLEMMNVDCSSKFRAFSIPELPKEFVIARHAPPRRHLMKTA